ncbi:hypothetical protein CS022_20275 [Veronia nyctiphanis]|uniref:Uncharacterized protein n=1 Tax=Veronia nyctiphanis TaxID=1278244 RepID=A0A4Q0YLK6_9GAMM|nr:hypothetical protein [Veronia nyctiphanis]RXJ71677.1 hypothetical protein CS022_20275 [Veronia nyctiphanis]
MDAMSVGEKLTPDLSRDKAHKVVELYIKGVNKKFSIQISRKKIEFFLVNRVLAAEKHDPVLLEFLNGNSTYVTRSARHYNFYLDNDINENIRSIWREIFIDIKRFAPDFVEPIWGLLIPLSETFGLGSQFTPTKEGIARKVESLQRTLSQPKAFDVAHSRERMVDYHNQYTVYTLYMLINGSGYRAVYNPLPSLHFNLHRHGAIMISDKDSAKDYAHMRLVAAPTPLIEQLQYYLEHLNALANHLAMTAESLAMNMYFHSAQKPFLSMRGKLEKREWFDTAKHSKSNDGTLVFLSIDKESGRLRAKNAGPSLLNEQDNSEVSLPLNFGRHYIRQYLQKAGVHQEAIKFQLGHWVAGEIPLSSFSTQDHGQTIALLRPLLDEMMASLGWKEIPSLLTRKRQ